MTPPGAAGAKEGTVGAAGDGVAARLLTALAGRGWSVAVAESLTGGQVTAALVDVPGASAVLRGGVVAYATDVKASVLGVDADLLAARGPVDRDVAVAMADGARARLGGDVGLATTGVAGPGAQDGHAAGTVHLAVVTPEQVVARALRLTGDRAQVRADATAEVLRLALRVVAPGADGGTDPDR